ncbi:MAG: TraR/DksA family transcriptional regulator [Acidobacteria bacterium]|nr:TraR/DksA family transcriptional regulator [Acidobacteriota bacterium]
MKTLLRGNGNITRKTYQKALLEKKSEVLTSLGINFKELADPEERFGTDPDKIAHDEHVRLRVNGVLQGQLRQIEEALERLRNREYGICAGCGEAIPARRLLAVPWARFCVDCQEQAASFSVGEPVRSSRAY